MSGSGGAQAGVGGDSGGVGGSASGQVGGGLSAGTAGSAGSAGSPGNAAGTGASGGSTAGAAGWSEGGAAEGGMAGAGGVAGLAEGGAGGSADLPPFEGRCGEGWAAGGSAGLPDLEGTVTPRVDKSGNWSFTFGRYRFVVEAARGGRVTELSLDGLNLLDPTEGSTFWPSPQQLWNWPPAPELDSGAYVAESDATSLSLTSDIAPSVGLSVQKRFWANAASGIVTLEYQLTNEDSVSASWAPWEVTRVRAGGYTFAPRGPGNRTITEDADQHPLPLTLLPPVPATHRIEWLNYPSVRLTQDNYLTEFDGAEGWLAHANRLGKAKLPVLFVKSFVDARDASLPTNQAEIQLWTSGTANPKLIEVEQQGEEQTLAPGESLTWTVRWSACELSSDVELTAGSAELAALARAHAVQP